MRAVDRLPSTAANQRPSVFVDPGPSSSPFTQAYDRFLSQALYDRNYPVTTTRAGADIVLRTNVQWFYYPDGNQKPITEYASLYTTAVAAGAQLRNISSLDTGLFAGLLVGPVFDFLVSMNGTTRAEVVVSTNIQESGRYHYLGSETVYVHPVDLAFYIAPPTPLDLPVVAMPVSVSR